MTLGEDVSCNIAWFRRNLQGEAAGAVVHEMVHVVQQYKRSNPGWLVEGIADYIRWFNYEPQKHGADIHNPANARYDGSYRVTANFLDWVTENYDKDIVPKLNAAMRKGEYREELWQQRTGKSAAELGAEWKASLVK
jgi:Peptidase of plants and bacteria